MRIYNLFFVTLIAFCSFSSLNAQMLIDGQVKYGNEWINFNNPHLDIKVSERGMYKVTFEDLVANGWPAADIQGKYLQMYLMGQEVGLQVTKNGQWSAGDYFLFYGEGIEGKLDQYLFENGEADQLNPASSMFADEASYFLRLRPNAVAPKRYDVIDNDLSGNLPNPEPFHMERFRLVFENFDFLPGTPTSGDVHFSHFTPMNGFSSRLKTQTNLELDIQGYYEGTAPDPTLYLRTGSNNADHFMNFKFNNGPIFNDLYQGIAIKQYAETFPQNNIRKNNINRFEMKGFSSSADNTCIAIFELHYPKVFNADDSKTFTFYGSDNDLDQYVEVPNYGGSSALLFDIDNQRSLRATIQGGVAKVMLPSALTKDAQYILIDDASFLSPTSISVADFENLDNLNPEFLIITSKLLNKVENGKNVIQEYADFRSSATGGGYKTGVINVETIYDMFGYGIDEHSIAIRNFGQYVKTKWPDLKMVFLVGKGLSFSNKLKNTVARNIVPTYGKPGSDNLLFAEPGKTYPYVAVGRLAAASTTDVEVYLNKAKINAGLSDVANLPLEDRLWLKEVLHLSGGDVDIQEDIYNYLVEMEKIIENNKYGANVNTIRKFSADPVTTGISKDILRRIDSGLSMMTFFGHSSAGTFDFSVEDPANYSNFGKHPIVFSMGCHSGDIHENTFSLSEQFIMAEDRGSVAFIASSGNAFQDALAIVGKSIYGHIGEDYYGQPLGLVVRQALEDDYNRILGYYNNGPMTRPFFDSYVDAVTLHQQNTFHGDPGIGFYSAAGPDFVTDFTSIKTTDVVGSSDETIEFEFDILNLGLNSGASELNNFIVLEYKGKQDTTYFTSTAPTNKETIKVKVPNPGREAIGKNSINIVLDYDNQVPERPAPGAEDNNELKKAFNNPEGFCFYVFDNSAMPIYPSEYGIINEQNTTLIASSSNALGGQAYYEIQIDTTENFDSPLLTSEEILSSPAVIRWNPSITYRDETVYYWRVKPKSGESIWTTSSFVYLADGQPGWNQSHYHQWIDDSYFNTLVDSTTRELIFVDNINEIIIKNSTTNATDNSKPTLTYQNEPFEYLPFGGEIQSGVYLATFDGYTGAARVNDLSMNGEFGSYIAGAQFYNGYIVYPYRTETKSQRADVINFIENVVPEGDYVALFTIQRTDVGSPDYFPEKWAADSTNGDPDLMTVLEKYGAEKVRGLANNTVPYILVFKKNDPSFSVLESVAPNVNAAVNIEFEIVARWNQGEMTSTTIGPATEWDKLLWNIGDIDLDEDVYKLDILGCSPSGTEEILFENVDEFEFDLSSVDATQYPNLKLNFYVKDSLSRTSPQLDYWRIQFAGLPEALIDIEKKFTFESDTILMGENFKFSSVATNVSNVDMDSLLVEYTITDSNNKIEKQEERLAPLKAFESIDLDFELETEELIGVNTFTVEINPRQEQAEQHYFNNIGLRDFSVGGDNSNPLLDVTIDGQRIMNGDIISPTPVIVAVLKDDNMNLPITDVSAFEFGLISPGDNQSYPLDLTGPNVNFFPADSTNGFCARIEYTPEPALGSGDYVLTVQGKDATGNLAGDMNYTIEFTVISESSVSNVLNYPNPFSTSTEFVFMLTGSQVPDVFTIQIFTPSGKVVKEINKEELGPLRIGQNRTSYKWNGTDDFGNRLANGVYLYRVITSEVEGEKVKEFSNSKIDDKFHKGFGKLVIMR